LARIICFNGALIDTAARDQHMNLAIGRTSIEDHREAFFIQTDSATVELEIDSKPHWQTNQAH
jgi:hypothetical protein